MPMCPNCGKRVSITDKRCSRCGTKLDFIPKPKVDRHYLAFALALVGLILSIISFPNNILLIMSVILGIIATVTIRRYARSGAVILVFASIAQLMAGGFSLGLVFYVLAIIAALIRG